MTSETLYNLILTTAQENTAILMIGSEGSRNDPTVTPDQYQDFDITYFVSDDVFPTFDVFDRSRFGDMMIQQILPEKNRWCWLMQFMDGNRLDLKIQPVSSEFDDSITEFFWVSTYVLKGILRGELLYANTFFESIVREELYRLLTWRIGRDTDFSLSVGKAHKRLPAYFEGIESLYDLSDLTRTGQALSTALKMANDLLPSLSHDLQLTYDVATVDRTTDYILRQL